MSRLGMQQPATTDGRPREERRPTRLSGWFVRLRDSATFEFDLVNLSYGGCRIRSEAALSRGEAIRLSFGTRGNIDATVRWRSGQNVGLAFDGADERPHWPRKAVRHAAAMSVLVRRQGRRSQWIDATDVSEAGCCLSFVDAPRVGDLLWVQLPGLEAIETEVRWVEGHRAGTVFRREIHPAVFELLLARWKSAVG
ncbi:hypothetical protein GCM10022280_06840 [Sphingomonas swuensis]|uniref:PilZ domain-containing protein n=1 Tax=Sphingomonas swuensis TaxID=977800 RepID=A0ABP7SH93_9SPHN